MKQNRKIIYSILIILSLVCMFLPIATFEDNTIFSLIETIAKEEGSVTRAADKLVRENDKVKDLTIAAVEGSDLKALLAAEIEAAIGYEVIMLAGKHDNVVTRFISAPGLWVQRITTKEPTLDMLEVAITSIKCALRDDFPEFKLFFEERGWEKKTETENEKPDSEGGEDLVADNSPTESGEAGAFSDTDLSTSEKVDSVTDVTDLTEGATEENDA